MLFSTNRHRLQMIFIIFVLFLTFNSQGQKQNFDSDQRYPDIKNLCFDISYKEIIKVNKNINVSTLTTLDKLTFKEKTFTQQHHRFMSSTDSPIHEIRYRSWYNVFPKWYTVASVIRTDETGTTSYFTTKNKYLRNDWFLDLDPKSYYGYYGTGEIGGGYNFYVLPHTQISLTSWTQEKEIIEEVGYLTFYRYSYPTTKVLQEFIRQGFAVTTNTRYITVSNSEIRITWHLNEHIIIKELLTNNTVTQTTITKYKYYEKFGQYLISEERQTTPETFENGDCYEVLTITTYADFDDKCNANASVVDIRSKNDVVSTLEVVPNPAHDQVTIKLPISTDEYSSIEIVDQMGRVVTGTNVASGLNAITMDINTLLPGIYFVKVKQGTQSFNSKFVKQ
jgi:hypothetical protein